MFEIKIIEFISKILSSPINEILSAFSFLIGLIVILFALFFENKRILKISGVILVVSLAFFTNTPTVFSISIFIIATLITELDFLENLAAIFRGHAKSVYDYKKEFLSKSEKDAKIEKEIKETAENGMHNKPEINKASISDYKEVEKYALDYVAQHFEPIERYVRIHNGDEGFEFDGIRLGERLDFIFEVKYTSNLRIIKDKIIPELYRQVQKYIHLTGKDATMHLLIISDELYPNREEIKKDLIASFRQFRCRYIILNKDAIGMRS